MCITSRKNKIQNCRPSLIIIREKETLGGQEVWCVGIIVNSFAFARVFMMLEEIDLG